MRTLIAKLAAFPLFSIGINNQTPPNMVRYVYVSNMFWLVFELILIAKMISYLEYLPITWLAVNSMILTSLIVTTALWANYIGRYVLAWLILYSVVAIHTFLQTIIIGGAQNLHFFILVLASGLVFMPPELKKNSYGLHCFLILHLFFWFTGSSLEMSL